MDEHDRRAVAFWGGDQLAAMMLEAVPGTDWFDEVRAAIGRAPTSCLDDVLRAADLRDVLRERNVHPRAFAQMIEAPLPVAYAIATGWRRQSPRVLYEIAARLGVPVALFVRDQHFRRRARVRLYEEWYEIEHPDIPF